MLSKIIAFFFFSTIYLSANAQNVGIGTTTPTVKLDIVTDSALGDAGQIRLNAPNLQPNIGAPISIGATVISQGKNNTIGNQAEWRFHFVGDNVFDNYQTFGFSGLDPAMTIRRVTGSVGIGTTDPEFFSRLTVSGNAIFNNGSVGIGTGFIPPHGKLHVYNGNFVMENGDIDFDFSGYRFWGIRGMDDRFAIIDKMGNNTPFYINRNSGNVVINNTSPQAKLDVAGNLKIADGTEGIGKVLTSDADGLASWAAPAGGLGNGAEAGNTPYWDGAAWVTDSSNIFNNGANVGIGTKTPAAKLDVAGKIKMTDGTQGIGKVLTSDANGMGSWTTPTGLTGNGTAAGNTTYWNGTSWMLNSSNIYNNGGNVGIGTTTPVAKLDVAGTFRVKPASGIVFSMPPWGISGGKVIGGVFQNTGSPYAGPQLRFGTDSLNRFWDVGMNGTLGYTIEENDGARLTIVPGGNVGIGTASPSNKLSVSGKANFTDSVGIGITNPSAKLHVAGTIKIVDGTQGAGKVLTSDANGLASWVTQTSNVWGLTGNSGTSSATHFLGTTDNRSLRFRTNNTEKMIIDSLGKVGIGTSSPSAKLDIAGNVKITDGTQGADKVLTSDANGLASWQASLISAGNQTGNTPFWDGARWIPNSNNIYNDGFQVGIGTSSPAAKLHVVGSLEVDGGLKFDNATVSAGHVLTSDASGVATWQLPILPAGTQTGNTPFWDGTRWIPNSNNIYNDGIQVGIGTTSPTAKLNVIGSVHIVNGGLKLVDGTQGAGKVLTSDANGLASWTTPGASSGWTLTGNTGTSATTNFLGTTDNRSLRFRTNNTEKMIIDSLGNVGIGTTTPGYKFTLSGGATEVLGVDNGSAFVSKNATGTYEQFLIPRWTDNRTILTYGIGGLNLRNNAFTNTMVLTDANRVGIGTNTPADKLHIKTGNLVVDDGYQRFFVAGVPKWDLAGDNTAYSISRSGIDYPFYISLASGNIGMGTTAPTAKLSVNGTANNTTGSWGVFSDARIKTVNNDFTDGLNVISKIHPVKFNYNTNAPFKADGEQIGIVAQELEKIAPYMVSQKDYADIKDLREVNNQAYVFLLINAVKELKEQNDQLKADLDLIKAKLGMDTKTTNR